MSNNIGNGPFWFGYSLDFWNSVSSRLLVFAVITGILAAVASGLSSWIGAEVSSNVQREAGDRITAAELELQQSRERTAQLGTAVAEANARAAEANRVAEEERLARVRIEAGLASRRLSAAQAARFTSTLAGARAVLPALNITLLGDQEAQAFGSDIVAAAQASGVVVRVSSVGMMTPPRYGIFVTDTPGGTLKAAFVTAGIPQVQYNATSAAMPTILVGLKPPPF